VKKGYTLDMVYMMILVDGRFDIKALRKSSVKIENIHKSLIVKGLVTEEGILSVPGKEILQFIESEKSELVLTKPSDDHFLTWWKTFPGTDTFREGGKTFVGSRALKSSKDECRLKFNAILQEGEYTAEQLIGALALDIKQKKAMSVKVNTNKLTYLQNSLTYLRRS